jgi:hypothetical protein
MLWTLDQFLRTGQQLPGLGQPRPRLTDVGFRFVPRAVEALEAGRNQFPHPFDRLRRTFARFCRSALCRRYTPGGRFKPVGRLVAPFR